MVRLLFLSVLLVLPVILHAQQLTREVLNKSFPAAYDVVYVVNGMAYTQDDSTMLDSVLQYYSVSDITEMTILRADNKGVGRDHPRNTTVIIKIAHPKPKKGIIPKLKALKRKLITYLQDCF